MNIFKCKMCGGEIELINDKTIGVCDSCGSRITLPQSNDEQRLAMFNRGNAFRIAGEFDKALSVYENIIFEDDTDAEAHWCCALCRFGIEYVEDPELLEYIPTCHRASYDNILNDIDYLAALKNADEITQKQYQREAKKISEVQKGILSTSQNEDPFDVFICYKETDDSTGERTKDSIDAQDIYYQLTDHGIRTFFSRITLENISGSEYEPYIFSALNSAKVMIVVGSKPEYFNAVWVKNEWSRFLALMRKDRSKLLLPCYKDFDPYDLPEQLSVLQSYDMTKIGFIQDLIRGIKKITGTDESKPNTNEPVVINNGPVSANIIALIKRGFMALEDGEFEKADGFFEEALNQDAENSECYLGKLMAELQVKSKDNLKNCAQPFDDKSNCIKASKFSTENAKKLKADNEFIRERNETARKEAEEKALAEKKEIDETVDAIAVALQKEINRKTHIFSEEKLTALNAKKEKLYEILSVFDSVTDELNDISKITTEIIKKINELNNKKNSLGIFAGKEKKAIDAELTELSAKKAEYEAKAQDISSKLYGYYSKSKVESKIVATEKDILCLQKEIDELKESNTPNISYEQAVEKLKNKVLKEAFTLKYPEINQRFKIRSAKVGNTIKFGKYYQSNSTNKEEIEWKVLEVKDDKALIISKKSLDCRKYNKEYEKVTWETCSLRRWLNEAFYKAAFSSSEQSMIKSTKVTADFNPNYRTNPGNFTNDKVFLLGITEVNKYFSSDEDRKCVPTAYAIENGAYTSSSNTKDGEATCWWWLRSPGYDPYHAAGVFNDGGVRSFGDYVNGDSGCVRPALWIEI